MNWYVLSIYFVFYIVAWNNAHSGMLAAILHGIVQCKNVKKFNLVETCHNIQNLAVRCIELILTLVYFNFYLITLYFASEYDQWYKKNYWR